ncbi:MAG TPA: hypothetical protein VGA69_10605, partial [Nitriliruptorales bacterium]
MTTTTTLAVLLSLFASAPAAAQDAPTPTQLSIGLEVPPSADLAYRLRATITTDAGAPVTGVTVSLYAAVELLGERAALLGSAVTDATGTARVPVTPRRAEYLIVARFAGDGTHAAGTARQAVTFPADAIEPFVHAHGLH